MREGWATSTEVHSGDSQTQRAYGEGLTGYVWSTPQGWAMGVATNEETALARQVQYSTTFGECRGFFTLRATEEEAQYVCDVFAALLALIHVAGVAECWANRIEAELARDFRRARSAYEAATRSDGYDYRPEEQDENAAFRALMRGWKDRTDG